MNRQSGLKLQQRVWDETKEILEGDSPDVIATYKKIGTK
jgi:hypothetical protein